MKKKQFVFIIMCLSLFPFQLFSKECTKTKMTYDSRGHVASVEYSKFDKDVAIPKTAIEFFRNVLKIRDDDSYESNHSIKLPKGHETFKQYYKGLLVDGAYYTFTIEVSMPITTTGNSPSVGYWILEITNVNTGEQVFAGQVSENKHVLNTSLWPSGTYVVKAIVGEDTCSKKIMIK